MAAARESWGYTPVKRGRQVRKAIELWPWLSQKAPASDFPDLAQENGLFSIFHGEPEDNFYSTGIYLTAVEVSITRVTNPYES